MPLCRLLRSSANTCSFCQQKVGNVIASGGGTVIGANIGMCLDKHLQPDMLNIVLNIAGLTYDDLCSTSRIGRASTM